MPPQDTVKWSGLCLLQLSLCLALPVPSLAAPRIRTSSTRSLTTTGT